MNASTHKPPVLAGESSGLLFDLGPREATPPIPPALAARFGLSQSNGAEIVDIEADGPADQAGILEGDVMVALGEQPATTVEDLQKLLTQQPVGIPATVVLLRDERRLERMVVPGEYPDPVRQ